jgi:hypothetical protein
MGIGDAVAVGVVLGQLGVPGAVGVLDVGVGVVDGWAGADVAGWDEAGWDGGDVTGGVPGVVGHVDGPLAGLCIAESGPADVCTAGGGPGFTGGKAGGAIGAGCIGTATGAVPA